MVAIRADELAELVGVEVGTAKDAPVRARKSGCGSEPLRLMSDLPADQWRPTLKAWLSAWLAAPAPSTRATTPGGAGRRPAGGRGGDGPPAPPSAAAVVTGPRKPKPRPMSRRRMTPEARSREQLLALRAIRATGRLPLPAPA